MTAENGGSAFLAVYLLVVVAVGVPGLLAEFVIGRRGRRNPVGSLRTLSETRWWPAVGALSVVTALALLSFYSVVGGWVLRYTLEALTAAVGGQAGYAAEPAAYFDAVGFGAEAVGYHLVFLGLSAFVVLAGVRRGIEVGTKVMMPLVLVLLVALAAWAAGGDGAAAAYGFYLGFDLSVLEERFFAVLGPAAGQALFTLSLGAGTMVTYASYVGEDRSLPADATAIAGLNTAVGVLAGLVVFPLLFSLGVDPTATGSGQGALFVGLAGAFTRLPAGDLVGAAFFVVVLLAALSSAISILEIPVAFLTDEFALSRPQAVGGLFALLAATGSATALSPAGFGFVAGTLVNLLLTAGLLGFLLFVGWELGSDAVAEFETGSGPLAARLSTLWLLAVGVALPVFLAFTLLSSLGVTAALGFWPSVAAAVVVAAVVAVGVRNPRSVV